MNTSALLSKIHQFSHTKTEGLISPDLLKVLPTSGQIIEDMQELGLLDNSRQLLHIGQTVEPVTDNEGEVIDLLLNGKALLNKESRPAQLLLPIGSDGLELRISERTYKLLSIQKKQNQLKVTLRIEVGKKLHIDSLNLYQSSHRNRLIQEICQTFHYPANTIREDFQQLLDAADTFQSGSVITKPQEMTEQETQEALNFAKDPQLFDKILSDYKTLGSIGEEDNKLICYLTAVSRLLDKPLSVMVISSSGAGKSALVQQTLELLPCEDVLQLTSLSAKALFYKDEHSLNSKVLSLEEDAGGDNASYAIRQLISSSALTVETTIRDQLDGKIKTQINTVRCQTSVFITSTNPETY